MKRVITVLALFCAVCFAQEKGTFTDTRDGKTYADKTDFYDRCDVKGGGIGSVKTPDASDIDISTDNASRSKTEIMTVVNARMVGIKNTYNKYFKSKPGFSGKVILELTISAGGDIIGISIVSSTTCYADFDNAVKNMVRTWKWKAIKNGNTTLTIPFSFM